MKGGAKPRPGQERVPTKRISNETNANVKLNRKSLKRRHFNREVDQIQREQHRMNGTERPSEREREKRDKTD